MSDAAAFVLGFSFTLGSLLVALALHRIADSLTVRQRTQIHLGPLVDEFKRWMRVHYGKEMPR